MHRLPLCLLLLLRLLKLQSLPHLLLLRSLKLRLPLCLLLLLRLLDPRLPPHPLPLLRLLRLWLSLHPLL